MKTLVPDELDLSLAVEREVGAQAQDLQKQWQARLEQARYEAQRAERRYKAVEPESRVVARTLERQWEERLRELEEVERRYAEARRSRHVELSEQERRRIRELAKDLPALWRASTTRVAEKKAVARTSRAVGPSTGWRSTKTRPSVCKPWWPPGAQLPRG